MQTKSKHFKDHEIKGVTYEDGKKVIHLKDGVRRKRFKEDMFVTELTLSSQLNHELINYEKWENFYKVIMGEEDYENE